MEHHGTTVAEFSQKQINWIKRILGCSHGFGAWNNAVPCFRFKLSRRIKIISKHSNPSQTYSKNGHSHANFVFQSHSLALKSPPFLEKMDLGLWKFEMGTYGKIFYLRGSKIFFRISLIYNFWFELEVFLLELRFSVKK